MITGETVFPMAPHRLPHLKVARICLHQPPRACQTTDRTPPLGFCGATHLDVGFFWSRPNHIQNPVAKRIALPIAAFAACVSPCRKILGFSVLSAPEKYRSLLSSARLKANLYCDQDSRECAEFLRHPPTPVGIEARKLDRISKRPVQLSEPPHFLDGLHWSPAAA